MGLLGAVCCGHVVKPSLNQVLTLSTPKPRQFKESCSREEARKERHGLSRTVPSHKCRMVFNSGSEISQEKMSSQGFNQK